LATPESLQILQDDLLEHRLIITAFCMHNRLDERLEQELVWAKKLVTAAQELKVNTIRIDIVPRATAADQFLAFAIKASKQLCEIVAGTPIRYGIENHGRITNDPAFLETLFDGVGSTHLGLTLDTCNFYWYGHALDKLYGIYEKFAARVFHTHCKNIRYPADQRNARRPIGWEYDNYSCPVYEGDIDYMKVAAILRQANYQGDLCLENECLRRFPKEQQTSVLQREIALLKGLT
jgi:sugar phosphate isomerase/epimerase